MLFINYTIKEFQVKIVRGLLRGGRAFPRVPCRGRLFFFILSLYLACVPLHTLYRDAEYNEGRWIRARECAGNVRVAALLRMAGSVGFMGVVLGIAAVVALGLLVYLFWVLFRG